ncbi:unnamed protein product [Dibothriocephalus latus]|uniref:Uncharacterized protein n=1 Tax=Dibothriocephalus latus TaxID=60516 RepID=A0A3P7NUU5_DIBLA|nr:unnamed protein product [Dibothriocephalus latus]
MKGLRLTVKLTIQNRQATVSFVPTASSLLIKALKEPVRDRKKAPHVRSVAQSTVRLHRQSSRRLILARLSLLIKSINPFGYRRSLPAKVHSAFHPTMGR